MTSPGDGGKAGAVGDVRGKSVEELMEILERQEKMLSNQKFIAKLPDRGKKILDYTEKVRAAITEHKRLKKTTDLLSKFKLEFEEKRNEVKEKSQASRLEYNKTLVLPAETLHNKGSNSTANASETKDNPSTGAVAVTSEAGHKTNMKTENPSLSLENSPKTVIVSNEDISSPSFTKDTLHGKDRSNVDTTFTADTVSEMSHKTNIDVGSPPVQEDKIPQTAKNETGAADDLVDSLKMININDSTEGGSSSKTSNQPENPSHPVAKSSHYLEVIEKRARSPVSQKEKFRPNRLPSDSNGSTPNQSPGERALRLSVEERRAQDRKHLDDITAARLPPLHHSPALLLPLQESLNLQIEQKNSYEEKQAKLAAQKLFEKLNIKMGPFNPEGDSYMKYRDQKDEGYDAEE